MKYTIEDVILDTITPIEFENLCYDLLVKYNFQNLIWRKGGADDGRDIEGYYISQNALADIKEKWFFECKHYKNGVPPNELQSKIAWADAEKPNHLVFFTSSYLSNSARTWLEKIIPQKNYTIILIEGEELKKRIVKYSDLVERYFSLNKYEKILTDIKDYKIKHNISPSYEFLRELIQNINLSKLDSDDLGFLMLNFFSQYQLFDLRNEYHGDFDDSIVNRILQFLKETITNEELTSFSRYKNEIHQPLIGLGIFDELELINDEEFHKTLTRYHFQFYELLLNPSQSDKPWKVGQYLFILFEDVAFEILKDEITEIRIIRNFSPDKFHENSLVNYTSVNEDYKKYLKIVDAKLI